MPQALVRVYTILLLSTELCIIWIAPSPPRPKENKTTKMSVRALTLYGSGGSRRGRGGFKKKAPVENWVRSKKNSVRVSATDLKITG